MATDDPRGGFLANIKRAVERADSWLNTMTNVGLGHGKTRFENRYETRFPDSVLENLYYSDPYASRICKCVPEESLRRGFSFRTESTDTDAALKAEWDSLHLTPRSVESWTWGRLFGGGAILIGADDGQDYDQPLNLDAIEKIDHMTVLDKRELQAIAWFDDPDSRNFGEPSFYNMVRNGGASTDTRRIHATRLVRFEGAMTNRWRRRQNNSWSESELQRVYSSLQAFNGAYAAVATLLQDASQGVFGIKDLAGMMASDNQDVLKKRLELMEMSRGVGRAIMIDADNEKYSRVDVAGLNGGLPSTLDKFMLLLAGAAEIPVTVLMGQAPAGLNATGDSDIRWYYDRITSAREQYLKPRMLRIAKILCAAKNGPTQGVQPKAIKIEFPSMYSPTPKEDADARKVQAETDKLYCEIGALEPGEISDSRFGAHGYSNDITRSATVTSRPRIAIAGAGGAAPGASAVPTSDAAVDPQFARFLPVLEKVAARAIPRTTGLAMLRGMGLSPEEAEGVMADTGTTFFTAPAMDHEERMAALQAEHSQLQRSHTSQGTMLRGVLEANKRGELVNGSPIRRKAPKPAL